MYKNIPSPCYVVDEGLLIENLRTLRAVADDAGCKILLAQKAFSMYSLYPLIGQFLDGATASGLHEARLAHEYMGKENHVFSAAYSDAEFAAILPICDHIIFNSLSQWERFKGAASGKSCGIRINPEVSTQGGGIYDPCAEGSRLGVKMAEFRASSAFDDLVQSGIEGLHFHTLCQQNADALEVTLSAVEKNFGTVFPRLKWLNKGGGHHITRADYDKEKLIAIIKTLKKKHPHIQVYLEPGEAVALNAGFLQCTVLDIHSGIAILDTSAACHMPDVLEMPYRPPLLGAGLPLEKPHNYRLGAPTCLAGDFIGEYSFDAPLNIGDTLVFGDMAIYSMVKNNTFNGINLPAIAIKRVGGKIEVIKQFGYEDFKMRLS